MEFILSWIKKKYRKNKIVSHRRVARIWKRGGGGFFERVRKVQTTLIRIFIVLESESHGLSENWDGISRKARKFKRFFCPKTGDLQKKRSSPKLRLIFRPKSEIQTFFPPKNRWSQKKRSLPKLRLISAKIGNSNVFSAQKQVISEKKVFTEIETDFGQNRKFKRFFCPKTGDLQKKRSLPKLRLIFRPKSEIQTIFLPKNRWSQKKKRSSPKLRLIFRPKSEIQTLFQAEPQPTCISQLWHPISFGGGLFSIFHQKSASKAPKTCDFAYFTSQWGGLEPPRPPRLRYWSQIRCKGQFRAFLPIHKTVPSQSIVKSMNKDGEEEKGRLRYRYSVLFRKKVLLILETIFLVILCVEQRSSLLFA